MGISFSAQETSANCKYSHLVLSGRKKSWSSVENPFLSWSQTYQMLFLDIYPVVWKLNLISSWIWWKLSRNRENIWDCCWWFRWRKDFCCYYSLWGLSCSRLEYTGNTCHLSGIKTSILCYSSSKTSLRAFITLGQISSQTLWVLHRGKNNLNWMNKKEKKKT